MEFLSDDWFDALDRAARARAAPDDDALAGISLVVEQRVIDGPSWQLVFDGGALSVDRDASRDADVRLTSDHETAKAIAEGREAALDAFMVGRLRIGGDVQLLVEHRAALEAVGDVFASLHTS